LVSSAGSAADRAHESHTEAPPREIPDIALDAAGVLRGIVVDDRGSAVPGVAMEIRGPAWAVARTVSDEAGRFAVAGLRGGTYQLTAPHAFKVCRVWTPGAAPPSAVRQIMLVCNQNRIRGQLEVEPRFTSDALLLGAIVVAGGAIPIVVDSNRMDHPSGS
jgi:hypothetical protein